MPRFNFGDLVRDLQDSGIDQRIVALNAIEDPHEREVERARISAHVRTGLWAFFSSFSYSDILIGLAIATIFIAMPAFAILSSIISTAIGFGISGVAFTALYVVSSEFRRISNRIIGPIVGFGMASISLSFVAASAAAVFTYLAVTEAFDSLYRGMRSAILPVRYLNERIEAAYIDQINSAPEEARNELVRTKNSNLNIILSAELAVAFGISQTFLSTVLYSVLLPVLGPGYALAGILTLSAINLDKLNGWRQDRLNNFRISALHGERQEDWQNVAIGRQWNNANRRGLAPDVQARNIQDLLGILQNNYANSRRGIFGLGARNLLSPSAEVNETYQQITSGNDGFFGDLSAELVNALENNRANADIIDAVTGEVFRTPVYIRAIDGTEFTNTAGEVVRERYELSALLKALENASVTPNQRTPIVDLSAQIVFDREMAVRIQQIIADAHNPPIEDPGVQVENDPPPPVLLSGGIPVAQGILGLVMNSAQQQQAHIRTGISNIRRLFY